MGIKGKGGHQVRMIVCNTGPILHLQEAKLLELLQKTGKVYIPKMVDTEMNELLPQWKKYRPKWIFVEPLLPNETKQVASLFLSGILGFGEAEAIILAKRLKSEWFLTDDTGARILANSMGIEVHGSLGIVLWSAAVGHLNHTKSKEALDRLSKTSLWISKDILSEARKALKTIFAKS